MKEVTVEAEGGQGGAPLGAPEGGKGGGQDLHNRAMKILRAREAYNGYEEVGEKPSRFEVMGWYLYEFCFYFVQTVLIPVVFPLIISQLQHLPSDSLQNWTKNHPGKHCSQKEIHLYSKLTEQTINSNFSALEWTSIAWATGLALAVPILGFISFHLDGHFPKLITAAATGVGVFFCLPAGFFKVTGMFVPYIAGIIAASTVASAAHTHHLGLMIRSFTGPILKRSQFSLRQGISSKLSLHATAAGCLGGALISAFTYHMIRELNDNEADVMSLWVVSIFSGLIWLVGILHIATATSRTTDSISFSSRLHPFSIFKYPHAIGALAGVFLSSFITMAIFTGGVIFIVGQLCIKPLHLLFFWLTYFLFPLVSLSLLQPMLNLIKMNSVKLQIVGFLLSLLTSGIGFYYGNSHWKWGHLVVFSAIQSTATGILHAFGRVLVLDCAPSGKEGAFSIWFAWMRAAGLCVGFTVGSVSPGHIRTSFGAAFCTAIAGIVVLLFGNISDAGGAVAAGHVRDESERSSAVPGLDSKETAHV
ncbi:MFS transporter superfamily [Sesbania bispinosa]|nr:MFS transporter superfamily [Sesbania bispinosa]